MSVEVCLSLQTLDMQPKVPDQIHVRDVHLHNFNKDKTINCSSLLTD